MSAALLDHLWQSTLLALAMALLTLVLRKNGAHTRYWLWLAASVKFLIPFSLVVAAGSQLAPHIAPAIVSVTAPVAMQQFAKPFSSATPALAVATDGAASINPIPVLLVVWALGFAALSTLWLTKWQRVADAVRTATPLALAVPIVVKSSPSHLEPGLVGIFRPVLLLPEGIAARLAPEELQAIVAHELCHLRRRDNLTASIHMLVEALFWFHPLVWWLGARLIEERERACDEAVVHSGRDPQVYAEGILKVCRFYVQSPLACAAGVSGADLKKRMEDIMTNRIVVRLHATKKLMLATAAIAVLAVPLFVGVATSPVVAAQTPTAVAQTQPDIALAERKRRADEVSLAWRRAEEAAIRQRIAETLRAPPEVVARRVGFADALSQPFSNMQQILKKAGPVKSITFKGVNQNGQNVYDVKFANAKSTMQFGFDSPKADGKVGGMWVGW